MTLSFERIGVITGAVLSLGAIAAGLGYGWPWPARAEVTQIAQTMDKVQRQLSVTNMSVLILNRAYWQSQADAAELVLRKHPSDPVARSLLNTSNTQISLIDQQLRAAAHP